MMYDGKTVAGLRFDIEVFGREGIEHHGEFDSYREAELEGGSLTVEEGETVYICVYELDQYGHSVEEIDRLSPWS